jgi:hypothetical protein
MGILDTLYTRAKRNARAQLDAEVSTDLRRIIPNGLSGLIPGLGSPVGSFGSYSGERSNLDINTFRQHFSKYNEVSKSDKFNVHIPIPKQIQGTSSFGTKELSLQCEMAELPSRDLQVVEYRHHAFTKRIPHMNQYNHASFTFYCTGDLLEKLLFDRWINYMVPAEGDDVGLVRYPQDEADTLTYESDILVNQYDNQNNMTYSVKLIQAMPISVAAMSQNWADDSVHRLTVTFAFLKWVSNQTDDNELSEVKVTARRSLTQVPRENIITNFTNRIPHIPALPDGVNNIVNRFLHK